MDLGKVLAEGQRPHQQDDGSGYVADSNLTRVDIDSTINLTAAAEAFLAKMREAEQTELAASNPPAARYSNVV